MLNAEQLKAWRQAGRELLAAEGTPATANKEKRTVDCVFFTGTDVTRVDRWSGDTYVLRFDPAGADLSLLNLGAPVLDGHDRWRGAEGVYGKVEKAWKEGSEYRATLRYSPTPDCDNVWGKVEAGIVTKFSMGVEMPEVRETRDASGRLVMKEALKWRPFEISMEPVPADFGTTSLAREGGGNGGSAVRAAALTRQREQEILRLR